MSRQDPDTQQSHSVNEPEHSIVVIFSKMNLFLVVRRSTDGLRQQYVKALCQLAKLYREAHQLERSINMLLRSFEVDRLNEEVHRELMITYWAMGRRDEAMRQYARCVRLLADELGISPSVETVKLALRIRAQTDSPPR